MLSPLRRIDHVRDLTLFDVTAKAVLFVLASKAHSKTYVPNTGPFAGRPLPPTATWCAIGTLAAHAGLGSTAARDALRRLEELSIVRVERPVGRPPIITINDDELARRVSEPLRHPKGYPSAKRRGLDANPSASRSPTPTENGGEPLREACETPPPSVAKGALSEGAHERGSVEGAFALRAPDVDPPKVAARAVKGSRPAKVLPYTPEQQREVRAAWDAAISAERGADYAITGDLAKKINTAIAKMLVELKDAAKCIEVVRNAKVRGLTFKPTVVMNSIDDLRGVAPSRFQQRPKQPLAAGAEEWETR